MLSILIPGFADMTLSHLVLDVNGTLTLDGTLLPGVEGRLEALRQQLKVHLLTADTRGTVEAIASQLRLDWHRVASGREAQQKSAYVRRLGRQQVVAIGNGNNDALMLSEASLGIAIVGTEGCATRAFNAADMVVANIVDALDLLLQPVRLVSTLRC